MTEEDSAPPEISVIVCVYDDPSRLQTALTCLRDQEQAPTYEVIIVDDGSNLDPASVVRPFTVEDDRFRFIVHKENQGLSAARNTGLAAAQGSIVAYTDADCRPQAHWLASLKQAWERAPKGTVAVGGVVVAADVDSLTRRYTAVMDPLRPLEIELHDEASLTDRFRMYLSLFPKRRTPRPIAGPVGANMSFDRAALTGIGGFDVRYRFGGDEYTASRALREKFGPTSIWLDPSLVMPHDFDPGFKDSLRRARAYGRGAGTNFARQGGHPEIRPVATVLVTLAVLSLPSQSRIVRSVVLVLCLVLPALVWRKVFHSLRRFGPEVLLYPSFALTEEVVDMIGFVEGWLGEPRHASQVRGALAHDS